MTISRRVFVKSGGLAVASLALDPLPLGRAAAAVPPSRPVLICIFQRGAVDGLSMIVPHGDPLYYKVRPRIAVPERDVVDLDGYFGLHPCLAALKTLWDNKSLAVIPAAGFPDATRSHLDAQDYLESGTPGLKATPDGWLNRYCQHTRAFGRAPFRAVAFGPRIPRVLAGAAPCCAIETVHGLNTALLRIAQLIKANVGLELAFVDVTGWDTHVNQGVSYGRLATRLAAFGAALATFARDMGDGLRDVVVVTMSEFGRTIHENGSLGTDHGHGTAMLVLGGPVNGGKVLGRWPGLDAAARSERRDVAVATDFRDLFSEVLTRHMRAPDPSALFPGFAPDPARFPGAIAV